MALGRGVVAAARATLDVRTNGHYSHASDEEVKDIYAYGAGLHSTNAIVGLSDFTNLKTLSLHGNQIERIEGLEVLHQLVTLNLSSNNITWMEGLSQLKNLAVLNLSNNRIREIAGLQGLVALTTLILSHNEISLLGGLSALHGAAYVLRQVDLRDNAVEYLCELWILAGCSHLEEAIFECGSHTNPVCRESGYQSTLLSVVPRLRRSSDHQGSSYAGAALINTDLASRGVSNNSSHWAMRSLQPPPTQEFLESSDGGYGRLEGRHKAHDNMMIAKRIQNLQPAGTYSRRSVTHADAENLVVNAFVGDCGEDSPRKDSRELPEPGVTKRFGMIPSLDSETPTVWKENHHGSRSRAMYRDQEPENSFPGAAVTRIVRFVDETSKPAPDHTELATQTDSVSGRTEPDQVCAQEALNHPVQPKSSAIMVDQLVDGNSCSYTDLGKQHFLATLELYRKDNELLYLIKEKKTLEDEFAAFKQLVVHERNGWQADEEHKSVAINSLAMNLKGYKVELKSLRETVVKTERELIAAVKNAESSIALEETKKLAPLNAEILALKESLNSSMNTCQTVGMALNDANQQKEKVKRALVSLTADMNEQRGKAKIVAEMLVTCTHQERMSRKECNRLKSELDMVCQLLRKNKDWEGGVLIGEQTSALWQAPSGRAGPGRISHQLVEELHRRLVVTQTKVTQALQENAKTLSSMKKLRDMVMEKMLQLGNAFAAVTAREQEARELITELSCVVTAQKTRYEWMQQEINRLTASEEEVEHLQAEIIRLQERNRAAEMKAVTEAEALKSELATVTSNAQRERRSAEEAACTQFSTLIQENNKLAARATSLVHDVHEAEQTIRAKTQVCESQEATINHLKDELVGAKNAVCKWETNVKVIEDEFVQRLNDEVEQKCELRSELTLQETIISEMEGELKLTRSAKYAAEQACKSLQQKANDVDSLLRHVDKEISSVRTLYEGREKTISLERDDALAKVTVMQKRLEDVEFAAATAMKAHFESSRMMEAKEQKSITTLIQKDIIIEDLKRKVLEAEAELHSRDLNLETQKAISAAKVDQLSKVLEELREVT